MKLTELQEVMGNVVKTIVRDDLSPERRVNEMDKAEAVARLAKQMINNADVVLRTEKLIQSGSLKDSNIEKMI